jgi:hypothetical protein
VVAPFEIAIALREFVLSRNSFTCVPTRASTSAARTVRHVVDAAPPRNPFTFSPTLSSAEMNITGNRARARERRQPPARLESVEARHLDVEQHELGRIASRSAPSASGRCTRRAPRSRPLQDAAERASD